MTDSYDTKIQWYQGLETYRMPLEGGRTYVYLQEPSDGDGRKQIEELHKRYYQDHQDLKDANLTLNIIYEKLGISGKFDAEIALRAIYELRETSKTYWRVYQDDCENAYVTQTQYQEALSCIRLFASVIQSGEEWSKDCQKEYDKFIKERGDL